MAVVSSDHADEGMNMNASEMAAALNGQPRIISAEEVKEHNGRRGQSFWAVIDGWVVDATSFLEAHPGGHKKLLSTDHPSVGATKKAFGFSFSRGRNAHFPETGKRFKEGVQQFLAGKGDHKGSFLPPAEVAFPPHGTITILGRLKSDDE
jgi:hypothetical protein